MAKEKVEASTNPEVAALQAQLAEMQQQMAQLLQQRQTDNTFAALQHTIADVQARSARQEKQLIDVENKQNEMAAYISLPAQQRSQYEINRVFTTGTKVFQVLLGTGKPGEWPTLYVKADTEPDAKARYQHVCGIRSVVPSEQHPEWTRWVCVDVSSDPAAKKAVESKWEYQAV